MSGDDPFTAKQQLLRITCPRLTTRTPGIVLWSKGDVRPKVRWECTLSPEAPAVGSFLPCISLTLQLIEQAPHTVDLKFTHLHRFQDGNPAGVTAIGSSVHVFLDKRMFFFSMNGSQELSILETSAVSQTDPSSYAFDLVLCNQYDSNALFPLSSTRDVQVWTMAPLSDGPYDKLFKELCPEKHTDMLKLLSDPESVNTAFMFKIDRYKPERVFAVWAHRVMLVKYPRVRELLESAHLGEAKSVLEAGHGPRWIPVQGVSLATFCALLKFLYCEDLNLTVDAHQFLISDLNLLQAWFTQSNVSPTSDVLAKALKECSVVSHFEMKELKDLGKTTWQDLFLLAHRLEILKMRERCLKKILASVNNENAMEILFETGVRFKQEIRMPVMKYIAEHFDAVFAAQAEDPFQRFRARKGFNEVMMQLWKMAGRA